jgi:hypothetical protein
MCARHRKRSQVRWRRRTQDVKNTPTLDVPQAHTAVTAAGEGNCTSPRKLPERDRSVVAAQNRDASGAEVQQARRLVVAASQQAAAIRTETSPIHRP